LLDSLMEQQAHLAEQGVYFEEFCTNAWTPEGLSLCQTLGMQHVCNHEEYDRIHVLG
jgi:hypothetical protein